MSSTKLQPLAALLAMFALATLWSCCLICSSVAQAATETSAPSEHSCCHPASDKTSDQSPSDSAPKGPMPCKSMSNPLTMGCSLSHGTNLAPVRDNASELPTIAPVAPAPIWAQLLDCHETAPPWAASDDIPADAPRATLFALHTMLTN